MDLTDNVALVTGGTMVIGAAVALELAHQGANVFIAARHAGPETIETQQSIEKMGRRCVLITGETIVIDGGLSKHIARRQIESLV